MMAASINHLIDILSTLPPETIFKEGFNNPHSYRGDYENLGVEPARNVDVGTMVNCLRESIGKTFRGYKGGDFYMSGNEEVFLAYRDCSGSAIIGYGHTVHEGFVLLLA